MEGEERGKGEEEKEGGGELKEGTRSERDEESLPSLCLGVVGRVYLNFRNLLHALGVALVYSSWPRNDVTSTTTAGIFVEKFHSRFFFLSFLLFSMKQKLDIVKMRTHFLYNWKC